MDKIALHNVVPHVFQSSGDLMSDVWQKDVEFERGKTYLIEAQSGKGKSSFLSYIVGYRRDFSGEITFDGKPTTALSIRDWARIRRTELGYLFQELRLFGELTSLENVEIKNSLTSFVLRDRIESWFRRLQIADKMSQRLALLSFGQQQRVAFIRALAQPAHFILLDEPISHLDDENSRIMGEIVQEAAKEQNAGIIVTSIGKHIDMDYDKILRL